MKIVDKRRFIRTTSILIMAIIGFIVFAKGSDSKGEIKYKESYIYNGDTLWSIALNQTESNKYFEDKDVREVVSEIKKINCLNNSDVYEGQKIIIPEYE